MPGPDVLLEPSDPSPTAGRTALLWRRTRRPLAWVLVLGWTLFCVGLVLLGQRHTSVDRLYGALESGSVDTVQVVGEREGPGRGIVELGWREHGIRYFTSVSQVRGPDPGGSSGLRDDEVTGQIRGDLTTALRRHAAGVHVEALPRAHAEVEADLLGWRLTGWLLWPLLVLLVLTLRVLVASPEPRRATRWAWWWLMLMSLPLGPLAYLLLGGALGGPRPPRHGARRLTGGWAFLLFLFFGGLGGS